MLLTGHKTRAIFDRYNIINEQELLEAGDQLSPIWSSTHRRRRVPGGPSQPAPPSRAPPGPPSAHGARPRRRSHSRAPAPESRPHRHEWRQGPEPTRPQRGLSSSADQPESRPADRRLDPRWSRGTAGQAAGVPTCFLHDCRRTAARNLSRAGSAMNRVDVVGPSKPRRQSDQLPDVHR